MTETGKTHSCSRTLRLAVGGLDPVPDMVAAPFFKWACAVWERGVSPALRHAWIRHHATDNWDAVRGPATSVGILAREIGWQWPHPGVFISRDGYRIDLEEVAPCDVRRQAKMDSEATMWAAWCQAQEGELRALAPRPFIEPLREWFKRRRTGHGVHLARQAVCGGTMGPAAGV